MYPNSKPSRRPYCQPPPRLALIRNHIAAALIGQVVDLMAGTGKIAHGVVSGVQLEGGAPKLLVGGSRYDLDQVLTAIPASFN
jgi:hypothetical protein